jgi:hypothetical protein
VFRGFLDSTVLAWGKYAIIYSFQRSFQLKVIPRQLTFLDQGKEWLNNFNSCRHLCAGWVKNIAAVLKI